MVVVQVTYSDYVYDCYYCVVAFVVLRENDSYSYSHHHSNQVVVVVTRNVVDFVVVDDC